MKGKRYRDVSRSSVLSFGFKTEFISILSCLNHKDNKHTHYTDIMNKINFDCRNSIFAYYIKRGLQYGLIQVDRTKSYFITTKGKLVLKMYHQLDVKFISNDSNEFCQNSEGDFEHDFNLVCTKCHYVKKNKEISLNCKGVCKNE